jgi:ABC-type bacteriocin/lantibiotic exporter with double-glycine peptidase domain
MSNSLPVPHRLQLADGYCLPACVEMVLAYWGIEKEQAELAKQLQMIPDAGTPANRIRLLASNTIEVFYGHGELADLQAALNQNTPPIALVYTSELPYWDQAAAHAVVVLQIDEKTAVANDPAMTETAIRVPLGDFELAWDEMANLYALIIKK